METMKKIFSVVCLAAMLPLAGGVSAEAGPVVLKASILQPEGDPSVVAFREGFKKTLEEKSHGKYRVDVFTGGSLGNADTVIQGIQFGTLHFATESLANFSQFNPELGVFDLPYLLPESKDIDKVFKSPVGQRLFGKIESRGLKVLDFWLSSYRAICSTVPIATLEDAKGLKIRTTASRWHMAAVQSLGLSPTPMAPTEIITGLQQGVIAGTDTEYPSIIAWHFIDVAKNVTLSDHVPCCWVMLTNQKWLDKLPEEDRAIVEESVQAYHSILTAEYEKQNAETLRSIVEDYGGKVYRLSAEEKQRWMDKSRAMYDTLPDNMKKLAEEIRAAIKE